MPRKRIQPVHSRFMYRIHCSEKRRYNSEESAQKAADISMLQDMQLELSVYKCTDCPGWHLTRSPGPNKS